MVVEFRPDAGEQRILVNVRPSFYSLTIDISTVYNFDGRGRLLGAYRDGHNYLRSLDNRILEKWGAGHGLARRSRRELSDDERRRFLDETQALARSLAAALEQGRIHGVAAGVTQADLAAAAKALSTTLGNDALSADAARFATIYRPVSILPPDRYLSLVLQATEGCSWNKCTFCDFYRDRPFRIKRAAEFGRHVEDVVAFFGKALALRTSIFLADANALIIPQGILLDLLDIVNSTLPVVPARLSAEERRRWLAGREAAFNGIYSFVDAFTTRRKDAQDYAALAERNVRRVYIGLESGDDHVLTFLHKGSSAQDACAAVAAIKQGGIDIGVIVMLGAGGRTFAAQHVRGSVDALNAMGLGERDIVYFSPFIDFPGSEYEQQAAEQGIAALSREEMDSQMAAMRAGLRFADAAHGPKMAVYDIREFWY